MLPPSLRVALVLGGVQLLLSRAAAQCPNQWESAPLQALAGNHVSAVEPFDDGSGLKLWAAAAGLTPVPHLLRWDRERWTSMGLFEVSPFVGYDAFVTEIEAVDLGNGPSLYAMGFFERIDGNPFASIARWTGSGWATLGSGLRLEPFEPATPLCAAVFDDGSGPQLYVGGQIGLAGGAPALNLARWNGASWSAVGAGLDGVVRALKVYDDGSGPALYAAGEFDQAGGQPASRIARWDGATWSSLAAGCSGTINALAVFDDGTGAQLIAGGQFALAGGAPAAGIAAWNGTSWSALGAGLAGPSMTAHALTVRSEGGGQVLYVGGKFAAAGGTAASNVARWDGASWSALQSGTDDRVMGFSEWSACPNGAPDLLAHGFFGSAGGEFAHHIAQWSSGDWRPLSPSSGADGIVYASLTWDDGSGPALYAGGAFQRIGSTAIAGVGRWNGQTWSAVGAGMNGEVRCLLGWNDGSGEGLYAGGTFTQAGGVPALGVARWNGSVWEGMGTGIAGIVRALHVHDDGSGDGPLLYAAGKFTSGEHVMRWRNGAWEAMTGAVTGGSEFASGAFDMVSYSIAGSSNLLVAAGESTPGRGVRRWNGSAWSNLATASGPVYALRVWSEPFGSERLYAGGQFIQIGPIAANFVARFDGLQWLPLATGMTGPVWNFGVWDDGNGEALLVAGETGGNAAAHCLASWDGSAFHSVGAGPSAIGQVRTLTALPSQDSLFVGGILVDVLGSPSKNIAWWRPDCSVVPYCVTSPNSAGAGALISTEGSTSVCASDFTLYVSGAPKNIPGAFYYGPQQAQVPFGNGWRCVGGGLTGIFRLLPAQNTGASGTASRTLDFSLPPIGLGPGQITAGSTWCFQYWYRDPAAGGSNFNLSDAIQATFVP